MSEMLGEMLLKVGALTEAQLEQVLSAQSIYGGRLGTNLVEMGLIGEDDLAHLLVEKLGVPCVEASSLDSIPAEVLASIPLELVQRYHVLPVALEGKRVALAMADPSDFKAVEEIGFVTGLVIVPRICSELRLNISLERYYGIKRNIRFIPVEGGLRTRFIAAPGRENEVTETRAAETRPPETRPAETKPAETKPAADKPRNPICGRKRQLTLEVYAGRLADAPSEAQVVSALLTYLGGEFEYAGFLRLTSDAAIGVEAVAGEAGVECFPRFALKLDAAHRINSVVRERRLFLGAFSDEEAEGQLIEAMGGSLPTPALVAPVAVGEQVGGVICVTDSKGRLGGGVFDLQRVITMAELAFEMLRIRKWIKAV